MDKVRDGILLGCGNPLLDISANVDADVLNDYALKPDDAILAEERHMPLYELLVEKYDATYIAGGSVQNSLRVCQWILNKPNASVFFGAVGRDKNAKILEEEAYEAGVNVQYQYVDKEPTGTCAVLITGKHRSLCANLAAANHFTLDHLRKPENRALIENAKYYYISGFFLTVSPPSFMEVAQFAQTNERTFMMNLSAPFLQIHYRQQIEDALPYVDILFGNETEALTFSDVQKWNTKDLKEIGWRFADWKKVGKRKRIIVLTQGSDPVLIFNDEKREVIEFPVERLAPEEVVDTNGAGDAFVGGFLSQYIQEKPIEVCVRCGIWTAREIIKRSGCTFEGEPKFEQS